MILVIWKIKIYIYFLRIELRNWHSIHGWDFHLLWIWCSLYCCGMFVDVPSHSALQELEVSSPVGSKFLFALPRFAHQVAKLLRNSQPEVWCENSELKLWVGPLGNMSAVLQLSWELLAKTTFLSHSRLAISSGMLASCSLALCSGQNCLVQLNMAPKWIRPTATCKKCD